MSIEAMKQALEHVQEFKRRWFAVPPFGNKVNKATRDAVTLTHVPVFQIEDTLRQAIAEVEKQEPVAWMYDFLNTDNRDEVIRNWTTQDYADIEREKGFNVRPLYTRPPKREWVGLTDEEIKPLCDENHIIYGAYTVDFIQSIEAKLKEKNT